MISSRICLVSFVYLKQSIRGVGVGLGWDADIFVGADLGAINLKLTQEEKKAIEEHYVPQDVVSDTCPLARGEN